MRYELCGNKVQVESLINTVFTQICVFQQDEEMFFAFESIEVDDNTVLLKWDTENLTTNANIMLHTALYYRFQDKGLTDSITMNPHIEKPADNHIRLLTAIDKYEQTIEDFCIYNAIPQTQFTALMFPVSLAMGINKAEILIINLSEAQQTKLTRQGKSQVKANAVHQKVDALGDTLHTTSRIVMNDVVNPLATAAAKVGGTIVSAGAKTVVDCGLAVANEVMRDAAQFSLKEMAQRDDVKTLAYSFRKMTGKIGQAAKKQSNNNFSL